MENQNSARFCFECGTPLAENAVYCFQCGNRVNLNKVGEECDECGTEYVWGAVYCHSCGAERGELKRVSPKFCVGCGEMIERDGASFCTGCGSRVETVTKLIRKSRQPDPVSSELQSNGVGEESAPKAKGFIWPLELIKRLVAVAVCVLICVSAFLPIFSVTMSMDDIDMSVRFTPVAVTTLFLDSLKSLDSNELRESDLREEFLELQSKIVYIYDTQPSSDEREEVIKELRPELDRYAFISARLAMQSKEENTKIVYGVSAGAAILLLVISALALLLSVIDLLCFVTGGRNNLIRAVVSFISLWVMFSVFYAATVYMAFIGEVSSTMAVTKIGTFSLVAVAVAVASLLFIGICRAVSESGGAGPNVKKVIAHFISIAITLGAVIPVFMPMVAVTADVENGKEATWNTGAEFFVAFDKPIEYFNKISGSDIDHTIDGLTDNCADLENYSVGEFEDGYAAEIASDIAVVLFGGFGGGMYAKYISLVTVLVLAAMLCACIILWQHLYGLVTGRSTSLGAMIPAKIFGMLFLLIAVAGAAVAVIIINKNSETLELNYSIKQCTAAIVFAVCYLCAIFCPLGRIKKKKRRKIRF